MSSLNLFLTKNKLHQKDLVTYLGVGKSFISQVVNGNTKLPPDQFNKLIENDKGWDISMLIDDSTTIKQSIGNGNNNTQIVGDCNCAELRERIKLLEQIIQEKERLIQVLMKR